MSTTTVLPPPHPLLEDIQNSKTIEDDITFYSGEMVLMRGKRISSDEVKRFYDLYSKTLPIETWWSYLGKDHYNKQIEYCKDSNDEFGYYMFHTKYIGKVKELVKMKNHQQKEMFHRLYIVEWEAREDSLMPGELTMRTQEHYPENLIALSKMTVMTKEEILREVLQRFALRNESHISIGTIDNL